MSTLSPRSGIQVSSVYPTYTHIKGQSPKCVFVCVCMHACMCVCVCVCMHVCVAKPVAVELWIHLYLNNRFFLGLTFCDFGPQGTVPQGGARGQNLGHLKKSFFFFFCFYFSHAINHI